MARSNPMGMPSLGRVAEVTASDLTRMLRRMPVGSKLIVHKSGLVQEAVPGRATNPLRGSSRPRKVEAYGHKGVDNRPWRKVFADMEALLKWAKQNDATIDGWSVLMARRARRRMRNKATRR